MWKPKGHSARAICKAAAGEQQALLNAEDMHGVNPRTRRRRRGSANHRRPRPRAGSYGRCGRRTQTPSRIYPTHAVRVQALGSDSLRAPRYTRAILAAHAPRHPLIPSTPLVATIALLLLDTPHRNPANSANTLTGPAGDILRRT